MSVDINNLEQIASQVRRDIVRMVHACQSGHPGGSLGCADYFVALYFHAMKHDTSFQMDGKNEDLFFLSNGHISPVFYSTLARVGYFPVSELATFRKLNTRLQGHPTTHEHLPGIRVASGSINGTSVMTGAGMVNYFHAKQLLSWSVELSSIMNELAKAHDDHYSVTLNEVKKHQGQQDIAEMMRHHLADSKLI